MEPHADHEAVWRTLVDVVRSAHRQVPKGEPPQLLDLIKCHRGICASRAVSRHVSDEVYRVLLRISLDPDPDWWGKLDVEREVSRRFVQQRASCSIQSLTPQRLEMLRRAKWDASAGLTWVPLSLPERPQTSFSPTELHAQLGFASARSPPRPPSGAFAVSHISRQTDSPWSASSPPGRPPVSVKPPELAMAHLAAPADDGDEEDDDESLDGPEWRTPKIRRKSTDETAAGHRSFERTFSFEAPSPKQFASRLGTFLPSMARSSPSKKKKKKKARSSAVAVGSGARAAKPAIARPEGSAAVSETDIAGSLGKRDKQGLRLFLSMAAVFRAWARFTKHEQLSRLTERARKFQDIEDRIIQKRLDSLALGWLGLSRMGLPRKPLHAAFVASLFRWIRVSLPPNQAVAEASGLAAEWGLSSGLVVGSPSKRLAQAAARSPLAPASVLLRSASPATKRVAFAPTGPSSLHEHEQQQLVLLHQLKAVADVPLTGCRVGLLLRIAPPPSSTPQWNRFLKAQAPLDAWLAMQVFSTWKASIMTRKRALSRLRQAVGLRSLSGVFHLWKSACLSQSQARDRVESGVRILSKTVTNHLRSDAWRIWTRRVRLLRLGERWSRSSDRGLKHSVFRGWLSASRALAREAVDELRRSHSVVQTLRARIALRKWSHRTREIRRLRSCVRRWNDQSLSKAMSTWREAVDKKRAARERSVRVVRHWRSQGLARALSRWISFVEHRRHHRAQLRTALVRFRSGTLVRCFEQWARATSRSLGARRLSESLHTALLRLRLSHSFARWAGATRQDREWQLEAQRRALNFWTKGTLTSAFVTWAAVVADWQRERELLSRAVTTMRHSKAAAAVRTWHGWARARVTRRETLRVCVYRLRHVRAVAAINSWRDAVSQRQSRRALLRRSVLVMQNSSAVRALRTWRTTTRAHQAHRKRLSTVVSKWRSTHLHRAVTTWVVHARERRAQSLRMKRVVQRLRMGGVARAMLRWRSCVHERQEWRDRVAVVVQAMGRSQERKAFRTWRSHAQASIASKEHIGVALGRWRNRSKGAALRLWREVVVHRREHRERLRGAVRFWRHRQLVIPFEALRSLLQERERRHQVMLSAVTGFQRSGQLKALRRWRECTQSRAASRSVLRSAVMNLRHSSAKKALRTWRSRARGLRGNRSRLRKAARWMTQQLLVKTFFAWHRVVSAECRERELVSRTVLRLQMLRQAQALEHWASIVRSKRERLGAMRTVALRIRLSRAHLAIARWSDAASAMAANRRKLRSCALRLRGSRQHAALSRWVEVTAARRAARSRTRQCVKRMLQAQVSRALNRWVELLVERRVSHERRSRMLKVATAFRHSRLSRAVRTWSDAASARAERRAYLTALVNRFRNSKLLHALNQWRDQASQTRQNRDWLRGCVARWRLNKAAAAVRTWHEVAHEQRCKRNAVAFWKHSQLLGALRLWRDVVEQRAVHRGRMTLVMTRMRLSRAHAAIVQWHSWAGGRRQTRETMRLVVARMKQSRAAAVIRTWHENARDSASSKAAMRSVVLKLLHAKAARAIRTWHENARDSASSKAAMRSVVLKLLHAKAARAIRTWHENASIRAVQLGGVERVVTHMRLFKAAAALRLWRDHASIRAARRVDLRACVARLRFAKAFRCLVHWLDWARTQGKIRKHVVTLRMARQAQALRTWRERVENARTSRMVLARSVARWRLRKVVATLRQWHDTVVLRTIARRAVTFWVSSKQATALRTWRDNVQASRAEKDRLASIVHSWRHSQVLSALRRWHEWAAACAYRREAAGMVLRRWQHSNALRAINTWRDNVQETRRKRELLRDMVVGWQNHRAARAIAQWHEWSSERSYRRQAMAVIARRWQMSSVVRALRTWADWTVTRAEKRSRVASSLARWQHRDAHRAIQHWHHITQGRKHNRQRLTWALSRIGVIHGDFLGAAVARAFRQWAVATQSDAHQDHVLATTVNRWRLTKLHRALVTWSSTAAALGYNRRLLNHAVHVMRASKTHQAINTWVEWTAERRRVRDTTSLIVTRWRQSRAVSALNTWADWAAERRNTRRIIQRCVARWKLAQAVSVLRTWRDNAHERATKRHQQRRALSMWTNATMVRCFTAWKTTVLDDKAERHLAERVARYWQHAKVAPALRSWVDWTQERQYRRRVMRHVAARWQQQDLVRALRSWRDWNVERRSRRNAQRLVIARWRQRHLHAALLWWHGVVAGREERAALLGRAVLRWKASSLARGLGAWVDWSRRRRRNRATLSVAVRRILSVKLYHGLRAWKEHALVSAHRRRSVGNLVSVMRGVLLRYGMSRWSKFAHQQRLRECTHVHWGALSYQPAADDLTAIAGLFQAFCHATPLACSAISEEQIRWASQQRRSADMREMLLVGEPVDDESRAASTPTVGHRVSVGPESTPPVFSPWEGPSWAARLLKQGSRSRATQLAVETLTKPVRWHTLLSQRNMSSSMLLASSVLLESAAREPVAKAFDVVSPTPEGSVIDLDTRPDDSLHINTHRSLDSVQTALEKMNPLRWAFFVVSGDPRDAESPLFPPASFANHSAWASPWDVAGVTQTASAGAAATGEGMIAAALALRQAAAQAVLEQGSAISGARVTFEQTQSTRANAAAAVSEAATRAEGEEASNGKYTLGARGARLPTVPEQDTIDLDSDGLGLHQEMELELATSSLAALFEAFPRGGCVPLLTERQGIALLGALGVQRALTLSSTRALLGRVAADDALDRERRDRGGVILRSFAPQPVTEWSDRHYPQDTAFSSQDSPSSTVLVPPARSHPELQPQGSLSFRGFLSLIGGLALRLYGQQAAADIQREQEAFFVSTAGSDEEEASDDERSASSAGETQEAVGARTFSLAVKRFLSDCLLPLAHRTGCGLEAAVRALSKSPLPEQLRQAMNASLAPAVSSPHPDLPVMASLGGAPSTDEIRAVALMREARKGMLLLFRFFRESGPWRQVEVASPSDGGAQPLPTFVADERGTSTSGTVDGAAATTFWGAGKASAAARSRRSKIKLGTLDLAAMRRAFQRFDRDQDAHLIGPEVEEFVAQVRKSSPLLDGRWSRRVRKLAADGLSFEEFCSCMLALVHRQAPGAEAYASAMGDALAASQRTHRSAHHPPPAVVDSGDLPTLVTTLMKGRFATNPTVRDTTVSLAGLLQRVGGSHRAVLHDDAVFASVLAAASSGAAEDVRDEVESVSVAETDRATSLRALEQARLQSRRHALQLAKHRLLLLVASGVRPIRAGASKEVLSAMEIGSTRMEPSDVSAIAADMTGAASNVALDDDDEKSLASRRAREHAAKASLAASQAAAAAATMEAEWLSQREGESVYTQEDVEEAKTRARRLAATAESVVAEAVTVDDGVSEAGLFSLLRHMGVAASDLPRREVSALFEAALSAQEAFLTRASRVLYERGVLRSLPLTSPVAQRDTLGFRFFCGAMAAAALHTFARLPLRDPTSGCAQRVAMLLVTLDVQGGAARLTIGGGKTLFPKAPAALEACVRRLREAGYPEYDSTAPRGTTATAMFRGVTSTVFPPPVSPARTHTSSRLSHRALDPETPQRDAEGFSVSEPASPEAPPPPHATAVPPQAVSAPVSPQVKHRPSKLAQQLRKRSGQEAQFRQRQGAALEAHRRTARGELGSPSAAASLLQRAARARAAIGLELKQ
jgi:hypothetical protein